MSATVMERAAAPPVASSRPLLALICLVTEAPAWGQPGVPARAVNAAAFCQATFAGPSRVGSAIGDAGLTCRGAWGRAQDFFDRLRRGRGVPRRTTHDSLDSFWKPAACLEM